MKKFPGRLLVVLILITVSSAALELGFRLYLRLTDKPRISLIKFGSLMEKAWFKPHPYLVYVFKPDNQFALNKFKPSTVTINRFGYRSTLEFEVSGPAKPPGTLRVATFGGSTTMGVNSDNEIWPYLIGKNLSQRWPGRKVEILNEGIMGYTSLDNLIDLSIRTIDFDCDVYVLYLGVNDYITAAPPDVFRSDYSHFRKTLWENLSFSVVELLPDWLLHSEVVKTVALELGARDRRNLLESTGTTCFRTDRKGMADQEGYKQHRRIRELILRNIGSMVGVIRSRNPEALIILSSFFSENNEWHLQYLNRGLERFAAQTGLAFVDAANQVPRGQNMAYDYGHFTVEGDKLMARLFSTAIISAVSERDKKRPRSAEAGSPPLPASTIK